MPFIPASLALPHSLPFFPQKTCVCAWFLVSRPTSFQQGCKEATSFQQATSFQPPHFSALPEAARWGTASPGVGGGEGKGPGRERPPRLAAWGVPAPLLALLARCRRQVDRRPGSARPSPVLPCDGWMAFGPATSAMDNSDLPAHPIPSLRQTLRSTQQSDGSASHTRVQPEPEGADTTPETELRAAIQVYAVQASAGRKAWFVRGGNVGLRGAAPLTARCGAAGWRCRSPVPSLPLLFARLLFISLATLAAPAAARTLAGALFASFCGPESPAAHAGSPGGCPSARGAAASPRVCGAVAGRGVPRHPGGRGVQGGCAATQACAHGHRLWHVHRPGLLHMRPCGRQPVARVPQGPARRLCRAVLVSAPSPPLQHGRREQQGQRQKQQRLAHQIPRRCSAFLIHLRRACRCHIHRPPRCPALSALLPLHPAA